MRWTFAQIETKGEIAGLVFYQTLFTMDPSLRALFPTSLLQARKLMDYLSYTVTALEHPKVLEPVLQTMGRRHLAYGVRGQHYDTMIVALLHTFQQVLGHNFSVQSREAWGAVLSYVAEIMKRGASQA